MNELAKTRARGLLRDKRFTSFLALFVISLLSALVSVAVVDNFLVLKSADNFAQDLEIAKETPPTAADDRIRVRVDR